MAITILLPVFLTACGTDRPAPTPEIRVSHLPPTKADIIAAAIRARDIPLTDHFLCNDLVSELEDQTFGRYLAGLIAYQQRDGENWVDIDLAPREAPNGMLWRATVMFHSGEGDFISYYGVWFLIRQSDGLVLTSSLVCPGTP